MADHLTGTREEWLAARLKLLEAEKDLTRHNDEVVRKRQELPWVRLDKAYRFDTDDGEASLAELFKGRSQLVVYHFMFGPEFTGGCPACSLIADSFNGIFVHLANHDVMLWAVSRAPLDKLNTYKRRMGWTFPWASSFHTDFNYDFNVSFTEEEQRKGEAVYNFRTDDPVMLQQAGGAVTSEGGNTFATMAGTDIRTFTRQREGMSAFVLEDGVVYYTYSTYARGVEDLFGIYPWLDRAPKGRNEHGAWYRRHDEYGDGPEQSGLGQAQQER